jgi:hypothetical protein
MFRCVKQHPTPCDRRLLGNSEHGFRFFAAGRAARASYDPAMRNMKAGLGVTVLLVLCACATAPERAQRMSPESCGKKQVLYCVESGSRARDGTCRCLSQEAAQGSLDNL